MGEDTFWYLQNIDVTGIFCSKKMDADPGKHVEKVYKKGDFIFLPGDQSDKIYFIVFGRVKIGSYGELDKEIIKAVLNKGEVFGELALIDEGRRRDFAIAMEDTEVCIVQKQNFTELFKDRKWLQIFFLRLFGSRILEMENRLENLVFKDSRSRIIDFLLDLSEKSGERVGFETVVRKFLTHQEIANLTATSRQTVTTVLNDLRSKGLIKFDRRRLLIRDKDKLQTELTN
jgi:CRP/FNR family cyclic AMP-dependent transcriptional regulator